MPRKRLWFAKSFVLQSTTKCHYTIEKSTNAIRSMEGHLLSRIAADALLPTSLSTLQNGSTVGMFDEKISARGSSAKMPGNEALA